MALFQKKIGPVFLKEDSDASNYIAKMQELEKRVSDADLKAEIQKKIKLASYGEYGENNISFELKNSGMDMYILHDICLVYGDLSAQIDYLVVTRKNVFIIECKNLIGNIEIDNQGNFVRTYELFGKKVKEGIYSPITQNQRHMEVLKNVRKESKGNKLFQMAFEHFFDNSYKSLIVLANPKTYLNAKFAPRDIKDKVIRADQIIQKMKDINAEKKDSDFSDKEMLEMANFFLEANQTERSDYAKNYEEIVQQAEQLAKNESEVTVEASASNKKSVETPVAQDLLAESNASVAEKDIETKKESSDTGEKICPRCGKALVLRTAAKGENVGNKFYGCSGFPKCRYIENIK